MKLASLGLFVFDLASLPFDDLARKRDWRHARSERVGARDAFQFVGPGQDKVTLGGCIIPGVAGSATSIQTLAEMADAGGVHQFADGTGRVYGGFVIQSIDMRGSVIMDGGVPRKVDFTIEIERAE